MPEFTPRGDQHDTAPALGGLDPEVRESLAELFRSLRRLAHDINNPLTAVIGRAQLLKVMVAADAKTLKSAEVIEESSLRIAQLIQELSGYLREGSGYVDSEPSGS